MDELEGQVLINGVDIWKAYGVFLTEEKKGGMENLASILAPSEAKGHVGVDMRESDGKKYSRKLTVCTAEREVTLLVALYAGSVAEWLGRYKGFLKLLKEGADGWLEVELPGLGLKMRMYYAGSSGMRALSCLWKDGPQVARWRIRLKEPVPSF